MIKKLIIAIVAIVVLLVGTLISIPFLFKDKIIAEVKKEINNNINAKVDWKDFDLTIMKSFPNLTFILNGFQVVGVNEFEGDTLANIKQFEITLNIMSVINGEKMEIKSITLEQPNLLLKVLKNGKVNWDIVKSSGDTTTTEPTETKFDLSLKKFEIADGKIIYDDASMGFYTKLEGLNHELKGDFTQDLFMLYTLTKIQSFTMSYGGMTYLKKAVTELKADLEMDMKNSKYTFKENNLKLNALDFGMDGFVKMPKDDIEMDIKLSAKQSDFKNFLSLVPSAYTKDFSSVKTSGKMDFNAFVKGISNDKKSPGFGLDLKITNAMFQYPSLPNAVNNINIDLKVTNPDGVPDKTVINIPKAHLEFGKEPFDFKLMVKTPVSDADIDAMLKCKVDLTNVSKAMPMEDVKNLSGILTADLTMKGKMSSIEKKEYEKFDASGQIQLNSFNYTTKDMPPAKIKDLQMTFNPKNVTLKNFDAVVGKSDMKADGTLDNLLAYLFKDETLVGNFNFSSNKFDCNEWMSEEPATAQPATASAPLTVFEVPDKIDFTLNANLKQINYDNMTLYNAAGKVAIKNKIVDLSNLKFYMLDGTIAMSGFYSTENVKKPKVKFDLDIQNMDIQKAFKTFNTVQKLAPIAEYTTGKFSTKMNFTANLQQDMMPDMNSVNGKGILTVPNAEVKNFAPIVKMAEALKVDMLKQLEMKDTKMEFEIKDGRIFIKPFDYAKEKINMNIFGSNGIDATLDYTTKLAIPRSVLGSKANDVINNFSSQAKSQGIDLNVAEMINVDVLIGGTVLKPEIKTNLKQTAGNLKEDLAKKAKEEFEKKKAEVEAKAKEEIEKVKAEADKMKKDAEAKAKAEADKLKAEAEKAKKEVEAKAKAEAEKAKKEAEEKAKKELEKGVKDLFKKPK